ncbi:MAG: response regulator transcription factor [Chloroflexales bacterium]|nr:response regulator transcription factor [Chloroflexales bacterium]
MIAHILIVDADGNAARVTAAIIARVVPVATLAVEPTVEGGRRRVQEQAPDMLLLDLSPNQRADDCLIREVKARNAHALVIALTARSARSALRQFPERQIDRYVAKGCEPELLVRALRDAVQQGLLLQANSSCIDRSLV